MAWGHMYRSCAVSWKKMCSNTNRSENSAGRSHTDHSETVSQWRIVCVDRAGFRLKPVWVARNVQSADCWHRGLSRSAFVSGMCGAVYSNSGGGCQHFIARSYWGLESSAKQNEANSESRWGEICFALLPSEKNPAADTSDVQVVCTDTTEEAKIGKDQVHHGWKLCSLWAWSHVASLEATAPSAHDRCWGWSLMYSPAPPLAPMSRLNLTTVLALVYGDKV